MSVIKKEVIIGDCRLLLGDCLGVIPMLGNTSHWITDPPYEKSLHDSKNKLVRRLRTDKGPELKGLNFAAIDEIRDDFVSLAEKYCDNWFISFCTIEGVSKWADSINESSIKYKRGCVWVKPDCTPQLNGQGPAQGCECFVVAWNGNGCARWNSGGKRGIYTHNTNSINRDGRHPTEKPVNLFMEILSDFTKPDEIILDPFMGIGTTGVACAKLGRKFIGIELDPDYFEIACERICKAYDQPDLFIEPPQIMQQQNLI